MTRRLLLLGFLVCFACCFALRAHAQTVGGACATTGIVTLTGANPGEILYCNSSNLWGLAEAYSSTGNVGIGTTAPLGMLSIGSGSKTDAYTLVQISAAGGQEAWYGANKAGNFGLLIGYSNGTAYAGGAGAVIRQVTGDPMFFVVNANTIAETMLSNGNVGIGSTSPVDSLDISQKTDAVSLPSGTSAQRPTGANGMIRYNSTVPQVEAYYSGAWQALGGGGGGGTITLGTSASVTNPQRSGDATTGLFSATTATVSIAASGTDVADFASNGLNLPVTSEAYQIYGIGVLKFPYSGVDNSSIAVGQGALNGQADNNKLNVGVGYYANQANGYGYNDTMVGAYAGYNNGGNNSTAIGQAALWGGGNYDTVVGVNALGGGTNNSTAVGYQALGGVSGANNTALGYNVGSTTLTTGTDNILIGTDSSTDTSASSTSNFLNIGNAIYATNLQNNTNTGGAAAVGIGTATPAGLLEIYGSNSSEALLINDTSTTGSFVESVVALTPNITASQSSCVNLGVSTASNNSSSFCFYYAGSGSTSNALSFWFSGQSTPVMTVQVTGLVGIGTATPGGILDIERTANDSGVILQLGNTGGSAFAYDFSRSATTGALSIQGNQTGYNNIVLAPTSGSVGIGTTNPAQALEVNGEIQVDTLASASATALCINSNVISSCSSSIRYKENVHDLDMGLNELMRMRPVAFKWKNREENDLGFIAEDMHDINPLLDTYRDGKIEGVKYGQLSAVIVNAVKEQQREIEALQRTIDVQQREIEELRAAVAGPRSAP